ncbi:MAG TPA: DUF6319 family protein [Aldersonia sp.]
MTSGKDSTSKGLAGADLAALASAVAEGKRPTVYLNDPVPGLGLPAGASARVVAVEGATVRVRPRGVADELPFEAAELRVSKTARAAKAAGGRAGVAKGAAPKAASGGAPSKAAVASEGAPTKAPVASGTRRAKFAGSVTITVICDDSGAWSVSVGQGERRPSRPRPVAADAVEKAIAELGDPAAEAAVRSALDSARTVASRRVEELTRQLDEARSALEALQ